MNLQRALGPVFTGTCEKCCKVVTGGDGYDCYVDLDAKPYEVYFHARCLDIMPVGKLTEHETLTFRNKS